MTTLWAARALVAPGAALMAGLMLPTALLAAAEANIAKTDAALLLTATLAFGALAWVMTGKAGRHTWLVFWLALSAAVLLKGPIIPVITALAVATAWLISQTRLPLEVLRPLWGLGLLAVIVLPWLAAIWVVSHGQFFAEAVGRDLLGKVAEGQEKHWGPPGLYLLLVWLTFWPWAAFLPAAIAGTWRDWRTAPVLILVAWVVPFWIVLEAVPTKLPHYVLPLYPALAILVAFALQTGGETPKPPWMRRTSALLVAVPGVLLGLAALALPIALEGRVVLGAALFGILGAVAAITAGLAAWRSRIREHLATSFAAALAIYIAVLQFGLPALGTAFPSPQIMALAEPYRACATSPLVTVGYREPSLVFLSGTGTRLDTPEQAAGRLAGNPGTLVIVRGPTPGALRHGAGRSRLDHRHPRRDHLFQPQPRQMGDRAPGHPGRSALGWLRTITSPTSGLGPRRGLAYNARLTNPEGARPCHQSPASPSWRPC